MDFEFIGMIFQMLFALGIIFLLMMIMYKVTSKKINNINGQKYINVLERVQISKDTFICIVKIGNKGHVLSTSVGKTDIIKELTEVEVLEIENKKKQEIQQAQMAFDEVIKKGICTIKRIKSKLILKEDTNEK